MIAIVRIFVVTPACHIHFGNYLNLCVSFWHLLSAGFQTHLDFLEQ